VRVRFTTSSATHALPTDAPFAIPEKLTPVGLSDVINHILGLQGNAAKAFTFILDSEPVDGTVASCLEKKGINKESVVTIEYALAKQQVVPPTLYCSVY
jgi:hypothetical protein